MSKETKIEYENNSQYGGDIAEEAMMHLIQHEPFYANLLMEMTRSLRTDIPTAGVSVTNSVNLFINPYFWKSLTKDGQVGILIHECLHILNNHIARFIELEPESAEKKKRTFKERVENMINASEFNIAADLAINEHLQNKTNGLNLPSKFRTFNKDGKMMLEPEYYLNKDGTKLPNPDAGNPVECEPCLVDLYKKQFPEMENMKHMEYYYSFLKKNRPSMDCPTCGGSGTVQTENSDQGNSDGSQKDQGDGDKEKGGCCGDCDGNCDKKGQKPCPDCKGHGLAVIDDHSTWAEGDTDDEYVKEKVRQTVNRAAENTEYRSAGSIPNNVQQLIDALNHTPKDWRNDLQKFIARTSEIVTETSRKKRNRRYGILYPGYKNYPKMHLAVAIDTSASVNDEELCQFMSEINRIHNNSVKVTIIECDSEVHGVYEFDPKKKINIKGRGGTAFKPAFDEAKKLDIDGLIYFTDGENWDVDEVKRPRFPVMWALLKGQKVKYDFGYKTEVVVRKKYE